MLHFCSLCFEYVGEAKEERAECLIRHVFHPACFYCRSCQMTLYGREGDVGLSGPRLEYLMCRECANGVKDIVVQSSQVVGAIASFDEFLLTYILKLTSSVSSILSAACVTKQWSHAASRDDLWLALVGKPRQECEFESWQAINEALRIWVATEDLPLDVEMALLRVAETVVVVESGVGRVEKSDQYVAFSRVTLLPEVFVEARYVWDLGSGRFTGMHRLQHAGAIVNLLKITRTYLQETSDCLGLVLGHEYKGLCNRPGVRVRLLLLLLGRPLAGEIERAVAQHLIPEEWSWYGDLPETGQFAVTSDRNFSLLSQTSPTPFHIEAEEPPVLTLANLPATLSKTVKLLEAIRRAK